MTYVQRTVASSGARACFAGFQDHYRGDRAVMSFAFFDQMVCDRCAGVSCTNDYNIGMRRERIGSSVVIDRLCATPPER